MAQPYVGEIRMFAGNFAPAGWMFCEGQLLPISENETLFQLIGTTYGGDGESTFALARSAQPTPLAPGERLHPGRNGGRRGDHANGEPDPGAHSSTARVAEQRDCKRRRHDMLAVPTAHRPVPSRQPPSTPLAPQSVAVNGRKPTAHEFPAVPVRGLHHLAVRDFPVPDIKGIVGVATRHSTRWRSRWPIRLLLRSGSFLSTSRPRAGRGATGSCCRCRRTRRCFRCWARPTAATASRTSRSRTCRAAHRCTRGRDRLSLHDLGETGRLRDRHAARVRDTGAQPRAHGRRRPGNNKQPAAQRAGAVTAATSISRRPAAARPDGRTGAGAGRRRPAAQQPAAVPDVLLLHRAAGRVSAADLSGFDPGRPVR